MTHEEPQPNYERRWPSQQRSSPQQDDSSAPSPARPIEWSELVDLFRPAVYGKSWTPTVRITLVLAVLAVVLVTLALILRQ